MAKEFTVSDEIVQKMKTASDTRDGETAANILEEVGTCGWASLAQKTNSWRYGLSVVHLSNQYETGTWFGVNGSGIVENLATVSDKRCETK